MTLHVEVPMEHVFDVLMRMLTGSGYIVKNKLLYEGCHHKYTSAKEQPFTQNMSL